MGKYTSTSTVDYIQHMGSDLTVVNAARVSFNKQSDELDTKDKKLIDYLAKHEHWSPFSHCFVQFRIKAPLFVARQLVKHQVGLAWNEVSRRYIDDEPEFYVPALWRGRAANNKQGSEGTIENQTTANQEHELAHVYAVNTYLHLLELGVAPEQARMVLPQTLMTEWFWSGSLYAFARVCKLRLDHHSQEETAQVAGWIDTYCTELFPISWRALLASQPTGDNSND